MNDVRIRKAEAKDIPAILAMYDALEYPGTTSVSTEEARKIFLRMEQSAFHHVYVAENETDCVGTFVLSILEYMAHGGKSAGILEDVVVARDYRSRGIGKKMVVRAMEICREKGCYKLALSSNAKRERAHGFYEKEGFYFHGYSYAVDL
jgi:GNAT superfamily N-acetyltransferase